MKKMEGRKMENAIIITGANRGLGLEFVKVYGEKGWNVFACARSQSEELSSLVNQYENITEVKMDVASEQSVQNAIQQINGTCSAIDIVINNAGVHFDESMNKLDQVNFDIALETFNINSLGPLRVTKHVLPLLELGKKKVLINISSEAGSITNAWRDAEFDYCMSKAALNMQSKLLQNSVKPKGIKVLSIHPGWLQTDMGGSEATDSPNTAALRIIKLAEQYEGKLHEPIYFETNGNVYPW